jgi:hypothetical protein
MRPLSTLGGLTRIPKKQIGTPPVFTLTSRTSFAYGTLQSPECCPRPHRHAPESTKIALLPPVLPYPKSGTLTRPVYLAVRVSAGVSRKSVHLFRWRSYFHKAFTGTKITPSRERLPNLFIQRGGLPCRRHGNRVPPSSASGRRASASALHSPPKSLIMPFRHRPAGQRPPYRPNDNPAACALPSTAQCRKTTTQPSAALATPTPRRSAGTSHCA